MAHTSNSSAWTTKDQEFKASLDYIARPCQKKEGGRERTWIHREKVRKTIGFGSRAFCLLCNESKDLAKVLTDTDRKELAPRAVKKVMGTNLLLSESGLSFWSAVKGASWPSRSSLWPHSAQEVWRRDPLTSLRAACVNMAEHPGTNDYHDLAENRDVESDGTDSIHVPNLHAWLGEGSYACATF
jgi:hypothetical protein